VGLGADKVVSILATRPPLLSKHLLSVTPVIAHLQQVEGVGHGADAAADASVIECLGLTLNAAEVEAAFAVPLSLFVDGPPPGSPMRYSHRDARFGPGGPPFRLHFFDVPCGPGQEATYAVWGLTAGILIDVATVALGREPAFQAGPDAAPGLAYERIFCSPDGRAAVRGGGDGAAVAPPDEEDAATKRTQQRGGGEGAAVAPPDEEDIAA
jgi:hypothetical protein